MNNAKKPFFEESHIIIGAKDTQDALEDKKVQEITNAAVLKTKELLEVDRANLMTVFGIFASITSFLTIEFQFLKTCCDIRTVIGFSLILFALLFAFNLALDHLVKVRIDKEVAKPHKSYIFLLTIVFCVGLAFLFYSNEREFDLSLQQ